MTKTDIPLEERMRRLRRLRDIAVVMDTALRIPGTGIRVGADSILGLVPGVGDAGSALVGLFAVYEARQLGVPRRKLIKMLGNLGADAIGGFIPVIGDLFDIYFKSNRRNLNILLDHFNLTEDGLNRFPGRKAPAYDSDHARTTDGQRRGNVQREMTRPAR